jgi:AbrB family looped-hinge helix DNA binding protein
MQHNSYLFIHTKRIMLKTLTPAADTPHYFETTLAERGQIVVPKSARDDLGLRPGMKLDVWVENNQIIIKKRVKLSLDHWLGVAPKDGLNAQEALDDLRGRPLSTNSKVTPKAIPKVKSKATN